MVGEEKFESENSKPRGELVLEQSTGILCENENKYWSRGHSCWSGSMSGGAMVKNERVFRGHNIFHQ